jgi:quercetin dioxygenase-like cupin family protein
VPISPEVSAPGRIGKTVALTGHSLQLAVVYQDPGAEIPWHSHPQEALLTLLVGSMEIWIGEEHFTLRPGWAAWMPANVPHRATIGPEPTIEIEAFSPVREEYAKRTPKFDFRESP